LEVVLGGDGFASFGFGAGGELGVGEVGGLLGLRGHCVTPFREMRFGMKKAPQTGTGLGAFFFFRFASRF
jgi:hypothetical protein